MEHLENAILCQLWNCLLQRVDKVSVTLQKVDLDLVNAVDMIYSLKGFVATLRDDFDRFESDALKMSPAVSKTYKHDAQRKRVRKRFADEITKLTTRSMLHQVFHLKV